MSWCSLVLLLMSAVVEAAPRSGLSRELVRVADRARPSVVHVRVEHGAIVNPVLEEVLAHYGLPPLDREAPAGRSTGSGVVVDPSGRVLTNHHVIQGAETVQLVFDDQRRLDADVVATDPRTDIAVLQLRDPGPYPWLPLGDREDVRVGEMVVAVGSPFDFQSTVTVGVVSATGRRNLGSKEIQDYIQTDAAVNPGNSGGPLLNLRGEVIGLNTAIYSPSVEQNSGISFAIPASMLRRIVAELDDLGSVRRPWMGVYARSVEDVDGDASRSGAEITRVIADSPAEDAGLRRGDVIVRVDGEPVTSAEDFRARVRAREVGVRMELELARDGVRDFVSLEPVELSRAGVGLARLTVPTMEWAGCLVAESAEELRSHFGLAEMRGLVVARVDADTPAAKLGLLAGDVVLKVANRRVETLEDLAAVAPDQGVVGVKVARAGSEFWVLLPR